MVQEVHRRSLGNHKGGAAKAWGFRVGLYVEVFVEAEGRSFRLFSHATRTFPVLRSPPNKKGLELDLSRAGTWLKAP